MLGRELTDLEAAPGRELEALRFWVVLLERTVLLGRSFAAGLA